TSATKNPIARRIGGFFRFLTGVAAGVSGAGGETCSSATLFDDDEHAPGLDRRAGRHGDVLHASGLGGAQLVLHLHCFDDHDGLTAFDFVAGGHQHADDAAGHRRNDLLLAVRAGAGVDAGTPGAAAVDR